MAFASGMAALTAVLLAACRERRHVVAIRPLYGGSDHLLACGLLGLDVTWTAPGEVANAVRPDTGLVVLETPQNPTLGTVDIRSVVAAAAGAPVLVDNTFATPVLQNPADAGAALVLHSATKYLGGHGDVVGGIVATTPEWAGAPAAGSHPDGSAAPSAECVPPAPQPPHAAVPRPRGPGARRRPRRATRTAPGRDARPVPRGRRRPAAWARLDRLVRGRRRARRCEHRDGVGAPDHTRGEPRLDGLAHPAPGLAHTPPGRSGSSPGARHHRRTAAPFGWPGRRRGPLVGPRRRARRSSPAPPPSRPPAASDSSRQGAAPQARYHALIRPRPV